MIAARRGADVRPVRVADAGAFLSKAREFLRAAADSYELGNLIAATGNAVHAGIAAADAIAARRAGSVWKGEHTQAAGHLERSAGAEGREAGRHLRRLLPLKNRAEYDPDPVPADEARSAVQAADRIVAIATRVIGPNDAPPRS
jgi:hypothetical protein